MYLIMVAFNIYKIICFNKFSFFINISNKNFLQNKKNVSLKPFQSLEKTSYKRPKFNFG